MDKLQEVVLILKEYNQEHIIKYMENLKRKRRIRRTDFKNRFSSINRIV